MLAKLSKKEIEKRRAKAKAIVSGLPEASAVETGTHMSLEVRGKRFGWFMQDHHGDGRMQINCKAAKGESHSLAASDPERFHIPAYVGNRGWIGFWLDLPEVEWEAVEGILLEAYRMTAPKSLAKKLAEIE